jgi:uncharacterized protein YhfF
MVPDLPPMELGREAHERFWADREISDDTLIVTERFRLVERLEIGPGG